MENWYVEGDNYFKRNKELYMPSHFAGDMVDQILPKNWKPESIYEFGACNGARLEYLREKYLLKCVYGCDPAKEAIDNGNKIFPGVCLIWSSIKDLTHIDNSYDLVIASFVLHWIDRKELSQSIAKIDFACTKYLVINDFYSPYPIEVEYRHNKELRTYKQDYARLFIELGYIEQERIYYRMGSKERGIDNIGYETAVCTLLKKRNK